MSSNRIKEIERISILTRLILQYCGELRLVEAVKLAKDLAATIDDLRFHGIDLKKLENEFTMFFPEHWKKRTQFFLIITKYWPEILNELQKEDVEIKYDSPYKYDCISRGLGKELSILDVKNKINVFEASDIFEEIDCITEIIKNNHNKTISIVVTDPVFLEVLCSRFELENIEYTSYCESYDRAKLKPFLDNFENTNIEISEFLSDISNNFGDFGDIPKNDFRQLLISLLDYIHQEKEKSTISVIKIEDIKYSSDDIIVATSLNEDSWKSRDKSEYWLHQSIRHKIGLADLAAQKNSIEDHFYSIFNTKSEIFLTRSLKANGVNCIKSSILSKFELICRKNNVALSYNKYSCTVVKNKAIDSSGIKNSMFVLPNELSAKSVELLIKDPYAFYAKEVLGLTTIYTDTSRRDFSIAFKNLMHSYFKEDGKTNLWLEVVKSLDFFNYQKCKNTINWLNSKNKKSDNSHSNIKGSIKLNINDHELTVFSYADRIELNDSSSTLISYQMTSPSSTKDIIYGSDTSLLTTCLIAKNGGFGTGIININEIQIWAISNNEKAPVDIKTLEINEELINNFEVRLSNTLKTYFENQEETYYNCCNNLKQQFNRYKHFERIEK